MVLIFNGARRLIAVVDSMRHAAELTHNNVTAVHFSCTGEHLSCGCHYYRTLHENVEIEINDLGNLTLEEYDELCGEKRGYYTTGEMAAKRKRLKERRKAMKEKEKNSSDKTE